MSFRNFPCNKNPMRALPHSNAVFHQLTLLRGGKNSHMLTKFFKRASLKSTRFLQTKINRHSVLFFIKVKTSLGALSKTFVSFELY